MEIPKIVITRRSREIKPERALNPYDRMNKKGYDIEVSTRSTYECYNITDANIKFALVTGALIALAIKGGLLGF
ncbi:MAG: hypothetical protein WC741_03450 [Patescibacteria group bacterium]|jgi:hypothetical protein